MEVRLKDYEWFLPFQVSICMRPTLIVYDNIFLEHKPWFPHPENPNRLKIALKGLEEHGILNNRYVSIVKPSKGDLDLVYKVHVKGYVDYVLRLSRKAPAEIDPDTYVSEKTLEVALYAIGALIRIHNEYLDKGVSAGVALVRPPGHHAGKAGKALGAPTQGFCIFNNIAILAKYLLDKWYRRIAIIDIDVHHGNGTQEIFWTEPRVLHIDFHQDPLTLYPGTGFPEDIGEGEGEGTKVNIVLPINSGDDLYLDALELAIAILEQFKPQVILFSAGFDAYVDDGLADMRITSNAFYEIPNRIIRELKPPLTIASLEGGYSRGLSRGLPAFVATMIGIDNPVIDEPTRTLRSTTRSRFHEYMRTLRRVLREYWDI